MSNLIDRKVERITTEVYRLTLDHFIDDHGKRTRLEEPLVVQMICDRSYAPLAVCLNSMIDKIRDEVLRRTTIGADE